MRTTIIFSNESEIRMTSSLMELAQKTLQPGQKSYRAHIWHRSPT